MQYYKGQLLENPLLEKTAELSVKKHHLLTDSSILPGFEKKHAQTFGSKNLFHEEKVARNSTHVLSGRRCRPASYYPLCRGGSQKG